MSTTTETAPPIIFKKWHLQFLKDFDLAKCSDEAKMMLVACLEGDMGEENVKAFDEAESLTPEELEIRREKAREDEKARIKKMEEDFDENTPTGWE